MEPRTQRSIAVASRGARLLPLLLCALLFGGCLDLGEPEIEDRWTRIDLVSSSVTPGQAFAPGASESVTVQTKLIYRSILTGFAVAELRASGTLTSADVILHPDAPRLPMAQDIDRILQSSVSMGRATRAITGWDHLIQPITFSFRASAPTAADSASAGLFLICYLAQGQEIELANGSDSLVITPFGSAQYAILPVGMELALGGP